MAQINFHTTPQFDADLAVVTAALKLKSKSEAIRFAVHQVAAALRDRAAREKDGAETPRCPHPSTSSG